MKSRFIKPTDIIQHLPKEHPLCKNTNLKSTIFSTEYGECLEKKRYDISVDAILINNSNTMIRFSIPQKAIDHAIGGFINFHKFFYKDLLEKDDSPLITVLSYDFFIGKKIENDNHPGKFLSPIEIDNLEIFYEPTKEAYTLNILIDNSLIGFRDNLFFPL